jgi:hypothetical protein
MAYQLQVGLLIGRLHVPNRNNILLLIPTPQLEVRPIFCTSRKMYHRKSHKSLCRVSERSLLQGGTQAVTVISPSQAVSKKTGQKGRNAVACSPQQLTIADDWVVEHARQVASMLPGGKATRPEIE